MSFFSRELDRYISSGLLFVSFGALLSIYSYYVLLNVPLTAMGLACVVIGATMMLVPSSPVPANTIRAMVEGSCVNIEAVLEEFDAREKAVYLPPKNGRGYAYVPLVGNPGAKDARRAMEAPVRVITDVGGEPGLMVFPPGSEVVRLSLLGEDSQVEEALNYVLVDFLEAAESVKATHVQERTIVQIKGSRIRTDFPRFKMVLGSLPISISGSVLASVLKEPMVLSEEQELGRELRAVFMKAPETGQA